MLWPKATKTMIPTVSAATAVVIRKRRLTFEHVARVAPERPGSLCHRSHTDPALNVVRGSVLPVGSTVMVLTAKKAGNRIHRV